MKQEMQALSQTNKLLYIDKLKDYENQVENMRQQKKKLEINVGNK